MALVIPLDILETSGIIRLAEVEPDGPERFRDGAQAEGVCIEGAVKEVKGGDI